MSLSGRVSRPGTVQVKAVVTFKDGTRESARYRLLVLPIAEEPFSIDLHVEYWGKKPLRSTGEVKSFWEWTADLDGPYEKLDTVQKVVWHLGSSFRNPDRTVDEPRGGFRLTSRAYSPFNLAATIHLKDGSTRRVERVVKLDEEILDELELKNWDSSQPVNGRTHFAVNALIRGPLRDRRRISTVTYHLPPPFPPRPITLRVEADPSFWLDDRTVRTVPARRGQRFELEAILRFEDGSTRRLRTVAVCP